MISLEKFQFSFEPSIYKFLNNNAINIMQIIFQNPEIQSKTLISLIEKTISISRSTSFRYLNSLHNNNLIRKKYRNRRSKLAYTFYDLTNNGKNLLHLFREFIVKKISFIGLQKGKKYCNISEIFTPNIRYLESELWYKIRDLFIFGRNLIVDCEIKIMNKQEIKVNFKANCINNEGKKLLKIAIFEIPFELRGLR